VPGIAQLFVDFGNWLSNLFGLGGGPSLPPNYFLFQHRLTFKRHPVYKDIVGIPQQLIVSQGSDQARDITILIGPSVSAIAPVGFELHGGVALEIGSGRLKAGGVYGTFASGSGLNVAFTPLEVEAYNGGFKDVRGPSNNLTGGLGVLSGTASFKPGSIKPYGLGLGYARLGIPFASAGTTSTTGIVTLIGSE
jgi:hypothetical protein